MGLAYIRSSQRVCVRSMWHTSSLTTFTLYGVQAINEVPLSSTCPCIRSSPTTAVLLTELPSARWRVVRAQAANRRRGLTTVGISGSLLMIIELRRLMSRDNGSKTSGYTPLYINCTWATGAWFYQMTENHGN